MERSNSVINPMLFIYEPTNINFLEGQRCVVYELARGSWGPKQVCDALRCSGPHAFYTGQPNEFRGSLSYSALFF